jgi:hypothetical protein
MLALIVGTLLAVGTLAYVLFPLFAGAVCSPRRMAAGASSASADEQEAVVALREIEFDRATGKLSDADYGELTTRYTEQALSAMRRGVVASDASDDAIEAAVLVYKSRLRSCVSCGPRPEPDAVYCSTCGGYLPGACAGCGAPVHDAGASFCASCGHRLAA